MDKKAKIGDKVVLKYINFEINKSTDIVLCVVLDSEEKLNDYFNLKPKQFINKHTKFKII